MAKADAEQIVTDAVIAYLEAFEAGNLPSDWVRPWDKLVTDSHYCAATGREYTGFTNIFFLSMFSWSKGFTSTAWGTYKQWASLGTDENPVSVKKGAKAAYISVPKPFKKKDGNGNVLVDSNGEAITGMWYDMKAVFNADQVEGWVEPVIVKENKVRDIAAADKFLANLNMDFQHGGDRAFYSPVGDHVRMPAPEAFNDTKFSTATETYYSTRLHETIHWTGHKTRCNRPMETFKGSTEYAFEELVAEMGATILCHEFAIADAPRAAHAQYIKSWLKALKNDKRMVFKACGQAQKAIQWMKDQQPTKG